MTKILIKAPNWVGDCILATPAIAFLRAQFPDSGIIIAAKPFLCPIFDYNPNATGTIPYDEKEKDQEIYEGIKNSNFDACCILPNSVSAAWFAKRAGIPVRVGYKRNLRNLLLTHGIKYDPFEWRTPVTERQSSKSLVRTKATKWPKERPPRHMVQYYMNLAEETARALGREDASAPLCNSRGIPNLILPIDPRARKRIEDILKENGLEERKLIGVCPAATGGSAKCWPNDKQAELIKRLAARYPDYAFVSTAITPEAAAAEKLQELLGDIQLYRLGEGLDVPGIVSLIDNLSLYITNDSGSMHIAAARQVPLVCVFGPTDWNVTYPWTKLAEIVRYPTPCAPCLNKECPIDHRCMNNVSVDAVFVACEKLLSRERTGDTGRYLLSLDSHAFSVQANESGQDQ